MVSPIPSVNSETGPVFWNRVLFVEESNGLLATSLEQSMTCGVAM
jgi:hypothetical protein